MTVWRVAVLAVLLGGMSPAFSAEPLPADAPGAKQEAEKLNNLPAGGTVRQPHRPVRPQGERTRIVLRSSF